MPSPEPVLTGMEEEQVANAQEALPVPWIAGERRLKVVWISRVYNQKAKAVKAERPGGKK